MIGITIRLPRPLHKKLAGRAAAEGRSINQQVIKLLQEILNRQEGLDEIERQLRSATADSQRLAADAKRLLADIEVRLRRLEAKSEPRPRRKAVTVAEMAR